MCPFTHAHKQLTHDKQNRKHIEEYQDSTDLSEIKLKYNLSEVSSKNTAPDTLTSFVFEW